MQDKKAENERPMNTFWVLIDVGLYYNYKLQLL